MKIIKTKSKENDGMNCEKLLFEPHAMNDQCRNRLRKKTDAEHLMLIVEN